MSAGRVENFKIAGGLARGEQCGQYPFDDTDIYKLIEGASMTLASHPDAELERTVDTLIGFIVAAQEADGYLYTARTNNANRLRGWMGESRWSNLGRSHELYDAGHLYEAAVAHYRATGKRTLLNVALRNADLVARTFGPNGLRLPPGHEVIEMGLVGLYDVTGMRKYLDLARFFLRERGRAHDGRKLWGEYSQDHKPVEEQEEIVGHAVRALYLCGGLADVAARAGDTALAHAADRLWTSLVSRKLYLTGGAGAQGFWEGFGPDNELPNLSAYCETCASIANVMFNQRMFLLHGDARYVDVLERALYNALLSGVSLSGDRFFYPNVLASRGAHERSPWFGCACCISNIARFIPSLPGYIYATENDKVYMNLFVNGRVNVRMKTEQIRLDVETRYPWDGGVKITVGAEAQSRFSLNIRIPGWATGRPVPSDLYVYDQSRNSASPTPVVRVNGKAVHPTIDKGYALLERKWKNGDVVELELPMPIRIVRASRNVQDDAGRIALERGPIVYCLEWPDNPAGHVLNLAMHRPEELRAEYRSDLLGGVETITGFALATAYQESTGTLTSEERSITAIPYFAWANRGPGEMTVWIAADPAHASPLNGPSIIAGSRMESSGGEHLEVLSSPAHPKSSRETSLAWFAWTRVDTAWVEFELPMEQEVSEVQAFWRIDDLPGGSRVPMSWRVLGKFQGRWEPLWSPNPWGVEPDRFNRVILETAKTKALRLEVVTQPGYTAGLLGWRVD
jgi:uncharacterized protein